MYKSGSLTIRINGKEWLFHFGMNAQDLYSTTIPQNAGTVTILKYICWAALKVRAKENNIGEDFSPENFGDLMDQLTKSDYQKLKTEALNCLGFMQQITQEMIPKMLMGIEDKEKK
jgi:hypothetical protein